MKKRKIEWLLEMMSEQVWRKYHLVHYWWAIYGIIDLNNYWRIVAKGNLSYLLWFCEWFLYIK